MITVGGYTYLDVVQYSRVVCWKEAPKKLIPKDVEEVRATEGAPEAGAGTAVMEMIGDAMRCAINHTCSHSPFILGYHFRSYMPMGGDSRAITAPPHLRRLD